jgi:hypothetical protein
MENTKYVSINRIIEEVFSFEGYAHEVDWNDMISWTGKALALINAPALYISKITGLHPLTPHIVCTDYRGDLPLDFVEVIVNGVRDSTSKEIYSYSGNVNKNYGGPTYVIKDNHIDISQEEATLELAYTAFKTDDNGFPMIPDIERVIEAIRSYLTYRIDHKLWRQNKLDRTVYEESKTEYLWYIGSAQNALRIMSPERRTIWTKYWTQALPTMMTNSPDSTEHITEDYSGYTKPGVYYPNLPSTP